MKESKKHFKSYVIMVIAAFCSSVGAVCYKALTFSMSSEMLIFLSRVFPLIGLVPMLILKKGRGFQTTQIPMLLFMGFFFFLAMYGYIIAIKFIPVVIASLLFNCGPLWTPFVSRIWLKERIHKWVWIGIIISFIGLIFVFQPGFSMFHPISLVALLSGMFMAIVFVANRKLSMKDPTYIIVFYSVIFAAVFSLSPVLIGGFFWPYNLDKSVEPITLLTLSGFMAFGYQFFRSKALFFVEPARVMPFSLAAPLFAGILAWMFFGTVPNFLFVIGAILTIGGMTVILRAE